MFFQNVTHWLLGSDTLSIGLVLPPAQLNISRLSYFGANSSCFSCNINNFIDISRIPALSRLTPNSQFKCISVETLHAVSATQTPHQLVNHHYPLVILAQNPPLPLLPILPTLPQSKGKFGNSGDENPNGINAAAATNRSSCY
jgi:hypothetical protein